jgi:hypothetical protein
MENGFRSVVSVSRDIIQTGLQWEDSLLLTRPFVEPQNINTLLGSRSVYPNINLLKTTALLHRFAVRD